MQRQAVLGGIGAGIRQRQCWHDWLPLRAESARSRHPEVGSGGIRCLCLRPSLCLLSCSLHLLLCCYQPLCRLLRKLVPRWVGCTGRGGRPHSPLQLQERLLQFPKLLDGLAHGRVAAQHRRQALAAVLDLRRDPSQLARMHPVFTDRRARWQAITPCRPALLGSGHQVATGSTRRIR